MKKLLIFLIVALIGSASALPMFGPAQGFRNPGAVELGSLTVGGVDINGGSISYDSLRAEMGVNETAINSSIDALTLAAYTNETAINASIVSRSNTIISAAYTNETAINVSISNLGVGQTTQNTTLSNLALGQTYQNTTLANLALGQTAQNNTASNLGVGQTVQNATLSNLAVAQTAQNNSITNLGVANTAQNATAVANKQSDYVNTTAITSSIGALVVPLATFDYTASSVDQSAFTASGGWVLTAVKMTPRVAGSDGSAVTVMVKICDSGEAPASGDNMLSGTLDLKGTADTPQSGTVSAGTIATGKIVALDFTGALTAAVGSITLYGTRA